MSYHLKIALSLFAVTLFLSSPAMAQRGRGGGGGPGGGGFGAAPGGFYSGGGGDRSYGDRAGGVVSGTRQPQYQSPSQPMSSRPGGPAGHVGSPTGRPVGPVGHPGGPAGHPGGGPPGAYMHHPGGPAGRPMGHPGFHQPYYGHWYHGDWHHHWARPWYYGPVAWFSLGAVTGAVVWDAPWHWGYYSYYNPYYTDVIVVHDTTIDYSRPIVLAAPPTTTSTAAPTANPPDADNEAIGLLNTSRDSFARGDYTQAMAWINQAIAKKPSYTVLHEFRALILFATGQYRQAAAAIYAVLSVGPGWDWATLSSSYTDPNVYTRQLRALEQYCRDNPRLAEARFLLAYHYMSCGQTEAAATEFKAAAALNPKDQLSAQMLAGLTSETLPAPPATAQPPAPSLPLTSASLAGDWVASRADGSSFAFRIGADGSYSWQFTQQGKTQQFQGTYTVADNLLVLKRDGNPTMIGQTTLSDADHLTFKLLGANASDPGIAFTRK